MRNLPVVSLVVLMGLPFSALADPQLSSQSLGVLEGTVARCTELDPKSAERLQHTAKRVVQGITEKKLKELRGAGEYQSAYESVSTGLGEMPEEQARAVCGRFLQGGK